MRALRRESKRISVEVLEEFMVTDLLKSKSDQISGAVGMNLRTGEFEGILAKAVG